MKQSAKKVRTIFISIIKATSTFTTGCSKSPESTTTKPVHSLNTEFIDSEVKRNVKTALHLDEKIKGLDISVTTLKGDVKLAGFANSQSQINYVHQLVRSVQGVHAIHDELKIKQ